MRLKNVEKKWVIRLIPLFSLLMLTMSIVPAGSYNEETCVDVKFDILTGLGIQDYYSGDHFWYNITLTNSGTTTINATFTVTVRNSTGGVFGEVASYKRYLESNDTTILYPNYTRLGKEEVYVYFMDTAGTYSIELTSDISMSFYRYYETGRYTVEHNKCRMSIDVMPSYQRLQNERWFEYMDRVEQYIQESRIGSQKTRILTYFSIIIAFLSIFLSLGNVYFSWWKLPKKMRKEKSLFFWVMIVGIFVFLAIVLYQYVTIIRWI